MGCRGLYKRCAILSAEARQAPSSHRKPVGWRHPSVQEGEVPSVGSSRGKACRSCQ